MQYWCLPYKNLDFSEFDTSQPVHLMVGWLQMLRSSMTELVTATPCRCCCAAFAPAAVAAAAASLASTMRNSACWYRDDAHRTRCSTCDTVAA